MRRTYQPLPLSAEALARIARVAASLPGAQADPRALADAVIALSHIYTRQRGQMDNLDKRTLFARAGFFLPRDLPKVFGPLDELLSVGLAPRAASLRILDVGAGLGATSLGLSRWLRLRKLPAATLKVVAVDQNARALRAFEAFAGLFSELPDEFVPLTLEARADDLRALRTGEKFDLILLGFVLNELFLELPEHERAERRADLLISLSERLSPKGAIVVLEPALKETSRELMQVRDVLAARSDAPFVIAPCLHAQSCPMLPSERDWCHQELPYALPPALVDVARAASLRFEGLSYASLVLANTPRTDTHDDRIRVVSDRLVSKGKLELYACSATGYQRLTRLDRHQSPENEPFGEARRGDVLTVEGLPQRITQQTKVLKHVPPSS